ncbi:MAG: HAD family hydrolase [Phycisphaerales bacterium]|jgi:putative hydrolase of the HAD superfamily
MTTKINAVLFDLGDTLLNFGKVKVGHLFNQAAKLTYDYLEELSQPVGDFKTYCRNNLSAIRWRYWLSLITGRDFNALELLKKIGAKTQIRLDENQWRHLIWLWYEPLSKVAHVEPDVKATLHRLKLKGIKLGILSNTFINGSALDSHLEQFGLLDFFDIRLYSYRFGFRKPDKRIFKAAAERIGERCENIMFVGDRINKDIRPAIRVGMTAVLKKAYTNHGKKIPQGAYRIELLSELPELIEQLNS